MNRAAEKDFASLFRLPQPHSRLESISSIITVSSVFTAAVLTAILYFTFLLEDVNHEYSLLAATFFLGVSVYTLNKVTDVKEDSINLPDRTRFVKNHRTSLLFVSLESLSIAIVFAFFSNPYAILLIVFAFYAGAFYSVGVNKTRTKDVLFMKNLTVAGAVTIGAVLFPLFIHVGSLLIITFVAYFIFLKVFINTVLFDVRDMEGDQKAGARTIPIYLGREKTRNVLLLLNSTLIVWIGFSFFAGLFFPYHIVLVVSLLYAYWYILRYTRANAATSKYEDLLVDGEWILLALYALPFFLGWPTF
ncbi:MAG: UbiA family prenyltransferase [Halobacteriota archaeon]|jgi:4-hydroxybenzoate polyprenyltransferase